MPTDEDRQLGSMLNAHVKPERVLLVLNKIDLVQSNNVSQIETAYRELIPRSDAMILSQPPVEITEVNFYKRSSLPCRLVSRFTPKNR